ncbi:hypothetical protein HZA97_07720 [Candidatus Woesearchaeota archaeon]|nr:hypothetical protein [Candidatus Woesearchaeota archaeon]
MEPLKNYLTQEAWKKDFAQTGKDISDFMNDDRGEISKKGVLIGLGGLMAYFGLGNLAQGRLGWAVIDFAFAAWNFHGAYQIHQQEKRN